VLQEMGDESKGSARSYGDFSVADAINASLDIIKKGGGHKLAAGVTLPTKNIDKFRKSVNKYYKSLDLSDQKSLLLPRADADAELSEITDILIDQISRLEPFGNGNPEPIIKSDNLKVINVRKMGDNNQHVKLELGDKNGKKMQFIAFGAPEHFFVEIDSQVTVWYHPTLNIWQGNRSVEGRLLHLKVIE
jgi:single-stranded-DNA-specific exonuclease